MKKKKQKLLTFFCLSCLFVSTIVISVTNIYAETLTENTIENKEILESRDYDTEKSELGEKKTVEFDNEEYTNIEKRESFEYFYQTSSNSRRAITSFSDSSHATLAWSNGLFTGKPIKNYSAQINPSRTASNLARDISLNGGPYSLGSAVPTGGVIRIAKVARFKGNDVTIAIKRTSTSFSIIDNSGYVGISVPGGNTSLNLWFEDEVGNKVEDDNLNILLPWGFLDYGNNEMNFVFSHEQEIYNVIGTTDSTVGTFLDYDNIQNKTILSMDILNQRNHKFVNILYPSRGVLAVEMTSKNNNFVASILNVDIPNFFSSPPPMITGEISENNFFSKFKVSQMVTSSFLEVNIDSPEVLDNSNIIIHSITDDNGVDLSEYTDWKKNENQIVFNWHENMNKIINKNVNIELAYPIIKSNGLNPYLEGDYLIIGAIASNSHNEDLSSDTSATWARPWGEAVHQEIGINTSTNELDPAEFIKNLDNKLVGDAPFAVGFVEEREFDTLGETSIGVVIESAISGIQNTIDVPVTVIENKGSVFVHHVDKDGKTLSDSEELIGIIGEAYETQAKMIKNYHVTKEPDNAIGVYQEKAIDVTYIYDIAPVLPVDPLDPETDIDPENPPVLPEDQGRLSIDFASQFNFGSQNISVQDKNYYAHPQRLLNEDGTVNEQEKRPNYVQISDRRSETDRNGWQLSVTQNNQFSTENGKELSGARMRLTNQQLATAHGGTAPSLQQTEPLELVPGAKRVLLMAQGNEGTGTWIYRFGDANTAGNSVVLDVPKGANPEATSYSSTFTWELSAVPGN